MRTAWHTLWWEVLCKNRTIFLTLLGLLGLAALTAFDPLRLNAGTRWPNLVERLVVMAFLISLVLAYAPFTFAESSGGWRMNSMLTRWFALPIQTGPMVLLPLIAGSLCITGLVAGWVPVLDRLAPGLDGVYFAAVLVTGLAALNALAWTVPRRPLQFWVGAAVLFPIILILALGPQDSPNTETFRRFMLAPLTGVSVLLAGYAWLAASRNRCGAWAGEWRLDGMWRLIRGGSGLANHNRPVSPWNALFQAETWPGVRLLGLSWLAMLGIVFLWVSIVLRASRPDLAFSWRVLPLVGMGILPVLGLVWLAIWGSFGASDPNRLFRARMSLFRATLPVSSGVFAGQRLLMLLLGWLLVWTPVVVMSYAYTPELTGIPVENRDYIQATLARLMATSAFLAVGALPVLLWGRIEGFGHFLLAAVCSWAICWALAGQLRVVPEEMPGWRWVAVSFWMALKLAATAWAFARGLRQGHFTWRYPVVIMAVWMLLGCALVCLLPTWKFEGPYAALYALCLLPLARLALSPLALAANRHR